MYGSECVQRHGPEAARVFRQRRRPRWIQPRRAFPRGRAAGDQPAGAQPRSGAAAEPAAAQRPRGDADAGRDAAPGTRPRHPAAGRPGPGAMSTRPRARRSATSWSDCRRPSRRRLTVPVVRAFRQAWPRASLSYRRGTLRQHPGMAGRGPRRRSGSSTTRPHRADHRDPPAAGGAPVPHRSARKGATRGRRRCACAICRDSR